MLGLRAFTTVVAGLLAVSLATTASASRTGTAVRSAQALVKVFDDQLSPETVRVPPISTVTWVNEGSRQHVVRSDGGAWQTFALQPGVRHNVIFRTAGRFPYKIDGTLKGVVVVAAAQANGGKTRPRNYFYDITVEASVQGRMWHASYVSIARKVVPAESRDWDTHLVTVFRRVPIKTEPPPFAPAFGGGSGVARFETTVHDTYGAGCQASFASPTYGARVYVSDGEVFPGETLAHHPFVFLSSLTKAGEDALAAGSFSCNAGPFGGVDPPLPGTSDPAIVWDMNEFDVRFAQMRGGRPPLSALSSGRSFTIDSGLFSRSFGSDCNSGETCQTSETQISVRFSRR